MRKRSLLILALAAPIATGFLGRVGAQAAKTVTLPVTVHFSQAMAAAKAIREGRAHVAVDGQLASEGAAVPFHVEHDLEFAQGN